MSASTTRSPSATFSAALIPAGQHAQTPGKQTATGRIDGRFHLPNPRVPQVESSHTGTLVELRGFEPLAFSFANETRYQLRHSPRSGETITSAPPRPKNGAERPNGRALANVRRVDGIPTTVPDARSAVDEVPPVGGDRTGRPGGGLVPGMGLRVGQAWPGKPLPSAGSQNQSSRGSKLVITWWPVSCQCAVACCDGLVSQHPM